MENYCPEVVPLEPVEPWPIHGGCGKKVRDEVLGEIQQKLSILDRAKSTISHVIDALKSIMPALAVCVSAVLAPLYQSVAEVEKVDPVYTTHNDVLGDTQCMTNIQAWAKYVTNALENTGVDTNAVKDIAGEIVAPTSNVVFNSQTYFALDKDELNLVKNDDLVWKSVYELTNYANTASVTLYGGQIAFEQLTSVTNLSVNLDLPGGAQSSGDAILRVYCLSNSVIGSLSYNSTKPYAIKGVDNWNELEAGDTVLTFTKMAYTNGVAEIWIGKQKSEL